MRNHQKSDKFKAGIAEFVGPLLKRLKLFKEQTPRNSEMEKIINQISTEIQKTKLVIDSREDLDRELASCLGMIEREIDYCIDHKPSEKASDMSHKATVTEVGESSNRSDHEKASDLSMKPTLSEFSMVEKYVESLDHQELRCVYSLCLFPVNIQLKKRLLIYWWSSMGLVHTSTEMIDEIFIDLVDNGVLIPIRREHNNVIDHCTIEPTFHKQLISLCDTKGFIKSEKSEEGTWQLETDPLLNLELETDALLNLDQRYLNSKNIISSMSDSWAALRVVQFGSWQCTEAEVCNGVEEAKSKETKSIDHIEVDETEFLKKLGAKVTYLSMRGISRIEELHEPIGKLENLMILDLRACHNLEKLPQKPRPTLKQRLITWALSKKIIRRALPQESRWFEKLRVLDISECYLLGHMPNWVCELSNLEVLKGFVVNGVESKHQSCRLSDLPKLNKLRKLTIRIAIERLVPADLSGLKSMDNLLVLTIIWGDKKSNSTVPTLSLPKHLEKLDIRCYPETNASELLNPVNLKKLKRLYIRGGKLVEIPFNDEWEVEILRLRFLTDLEINWDMWDIPSSFKNLKCVEHVGCPKLKLKNFPEGKSLWIKENNEHFQGTNASGAGLNCEHVISAPAQVKLDLQNVELKLKGSATYLSWSRQVKRALSGRNLEGYLTVEKGEPAKGSVEHNEWKTTHSLLHTWLLNSMDESIAVMVDGIEAVSDVWGKLQRIYAGADINLRVFQIEREIEAVAQRERSIQEYAADLERLWADYDHFSPPACCRDPECKKGDERVQRRTMHFLRGLDPAFEPRCAVLLAQPKIPTLDEVISAMIQEESRIRLQVRAGGLP